MTESEMLDHLEYKGYTVNTDLELMALAEALGYTYQNETGLWIEE